jgi:hypothetical protein
MMEAENDLLLRAARVSPNPVIQEEIAWLAGRVTDWGYLVAAADRHGLVPLLCLHLENLCPEAVPEARLKELQDRFRKNAISNLLLTREMLDILGLFEAEQIPAIPFKGPTLAVAVYNDLAFRKFGDLDFFIRRKDFIWATRLLVGRGYRPDYELNEADEASYLESQCEHGLKGRAYVELQWEIVPKNYTFTINDEHLWRRRRQISIEGARAPHLSAEDLLLVLSAHGAKGRWRRLSWITDVAGVISNDHELNWDKATERAARLGGARMLLLAVALAHGVLGVQLPGPVIERIKTDRAVKRLAAKARERLFEGDQAQSDVLTTGLFYLSARERGRDKIKCCVRMATSPTVKDKTFIRLPGALSAFYYPLRPVRLAGKYGLRAIKKIL